MQLLGKHLQGNCELTMHAEPQLTYTSHYGDQFITIWAASIYLELHDSTSQRLLRQAPSRDAQYHL